MTSALTLWSLLADARQRLTEAGVDDPILDARILLEEAIAPAPWQGLHRLRDLVPAAGVAARFAALIARRERREPVFRILGRREFRGLSFLLSPATLEPRPDSETVVDAALALFPEPNARVCVLDIGTGTGCLLLAFLAARSWSWGVGTDRSLAALIAAERNARDLGLAGQTAWLCGDWLQAVRGPVDLVLANPPYICTNDLPGLAPEVREHDPPAALDGGPDGLDAYRSILTNIRNVLSPDGRVVLELGAGQLADVASLSISNGLDVLDVTSDISGNPRAICLASIHNIE